MWSPICDIFKEDEMSKCENCGYETPIGTQCDNCGVFAYGNADDNQTVNTNAGKHIIQDSGERQVFASGAVRDTQKGKGRFDLLPLSAIFTVVPTINGHAFATCVLSRIELFKQTGKVNDLREALRIIIKDYESEYLFIEALAKHFEAGAEKYGDNNWQKGLPASRYIDSALRHLLKYLDGQTDEPHKVAFAWNILCCYWTCANLPKLNDYQKAGEDDND